MAEPMDTEVNNQIIVVEVDSGDVPESELSQFQEVEVIVKDDEMRDGEIMTEEAEVIQRFVCSGKNELPDIYTKLKPGEGEEEEEDNDDDEDVKFDIEDCKDHDEKTRNTSKPADWELEENSFEEKPNISKMAGISAQSTDEGESWPIQRSSTARRRTVLNASLQGLMGQANLSFARGQTDIAEKLCLEIIRQNPLVPEPFLTLADIYETRNPEKFINFLTIAAHLNAHDRDQWIRIAEMQAARGNRQQARIYYTKALRIMPRDYDLRLRKIRLLDEMGDKMSAMYARLNMIPHIPPSEAELCLSTAKEVAHFFHAKKRPRPALDAMESAYKVCKEQFTPEMLNLFLELLLQQKLYARVVQCIRERANVELEAEQECNLQVIYFCVIPNDLLPEFRGKLFVSLVHLQAFHLLGYLIQNMHEAVPVEDVRHLDLYVDITEALMQEERFMDALKLLEPITDLKDSKVECPALVWLLHAKCMCALQRTEEAIQSYQRVVDLSPYCYEARYPLAALLKQQGRKLEAVQTLEMPTATMADSDGEGEEAPPVSARLLYERCLLLYDIGYIDEFFDVGYELLSRFSIKLRTREEITAVASGGTLYNADNLKVILRLRNMAEDTDITLQDHLRSAGGIVTESDLSMEDEYSLFEHLLQTAYAHHRHGFNQRLCFAMVTTKRFLPTHTTELQRIISLACYYNDQCSLAFAYLRDLLGKQTTNMSLWNFLALLIQKGQDLRYHRFAFRLLRRSSCPRRTKLFLAHYHHSCSSYKYALNLYAPFFREQEDPMVALCIAVIFNQMSSQKRVLRKTAAVGQALAFIHKYADWRSYGEGIKADEAAQRNYQNIATGQEINYNIGRIYHQCGMMHLAMIYYERALAVRHPLLEENEETLGLRQEVAFNLHVIYRAAGNKMMARQVLYDHCVI